MRKWSTNVAHILFYCRWHWMPPNGSLIFQNRYCIWTEQFQIHLTSSYPHFTRACRHLVGNIFCLPFFVSRAMRHENDFVRSFCFRYILICSVVFVIYVVHFVYIFFWVKVPKKVVLSDCLTVPLDIKIVVKIHYILYVYNICVKTAMPSPCNALALFG